MAERWFLSLVIILLLVLIFAPSTTFYKFKQELFSGQGTQINFSNGVVMENTMLKARLAELYSIQDKLPLRQTGVIPAFVYSRYPFNFKNEIMVNAGQKQGIVVGEAVVVSNSTSSLDGRNQNFIFIGKVKNVFEDAALIQTVFDSGFRLAVRIGKAGIDSLLVGGVDPTLTLIPKNAEINSGEAVYSVGADFPYGIPMGEVGEIKLSHDNLFKEANILFPYDLSQVNLVLIFKNTNPQYNSDGH